MLAMLFGANLIDFNITKYCFQIHSLDCSENIHSNQSIILMCHIIGPDMDYIYRKDCNQTNYSGFDDNSLKVAI